MVGDKESKERETEAEERPYIHFIHGTPAAYKKKRRKKQTLKPLLKKNANTKKNDAAYRDV